MINGKSIGVVLPAYNCSKTLYSVYKEIPHSIVDEIIVVDDCSSDETFYMAQQLNMQHIIKHDLNLDYGANRKTCYNKALELGVDIVVMLHPDYQYRPSLIYNMAEIIANTSNKIVFASRIKDGNALSNGMPLYKYIANVVLTKFQNCVLNKNLSEYHTGYRAYSREVLQQIDYNSNTNGFIFDNQIILQFFEKGYEIFEIACPAKYNNDSSSIGILRSSIYGMKIIYYTVMYKFKRK